MKKEFLTTLHWFTSPGWIIYKYALVLLNILGYFSRVYIFVLVLVFIFWRSFLCASSLVISWMFVNSDYSLSGSPPGVGSCWTIIIKKELGAGYPLLKSLGQGSPTPGPLPVRYPAAQQEVSGRRASQASSAALHHSHYHLSHPPCHPTPPLPMEKLSSTKPVPGAKNVGDHCSRVFRVRSCCWKHPYCIYRVSSAKLPKIRPMIKGFATETGHIWIHIHRWYLSGLRSVMPEWVSILITDRVSLVGVNLGVVKC